MRVEQNRAVKSWLAILLIACVAIALRMYAMDRLPPGLFGDEAVEPLAAVGISHPQGDAPHGAAR